MKFIYQKRTVVSGSSNMVCLEPENDRDRHQAELMLKDDPKSVCGFGRHGETGELIHVQIKVE